MTDREQRLMPDNEPRYVRCYDNGGASFDRYTVVFTGRYKHQTAGQSLYLGMSENPYHPQGFGQHGESDTPIDRPTSRHLGKRIAFSALPEPCQKLVRADYRHLWSL